MRTIEIDDALYDYIASNTRRIGESASDILRRLLLGEGTEQASTAPASPLADMDIESQLSAALTGQGKQRDRFLAALAVVYRFNPGCFDKLVDLRGRQRRYFARSAEALTAAGNSTRPYAIPGSPFWVVTNANGAKKQRLLAQAMSTAGLAPDLQERVLSHFAVSQEI